MWGGIGDGDDLDEVGDIRGNKLCPGENKDEGDDLSPREDGG